MQNECILYGSCSVCFCEKNVYCTVAAVYAVLRNVCILYVSYGIFCCKIYVKCKVDALYAVGKCI